MEKVRISIDGVRKEWKVNTKEEANKLREHLINKYSDKDLFGEVWRPIIGFSRYQASSYGRVRSLNYKNSGLKKVLTPTKSNDGYLQTMIQSDNGKYKSMRVHRIVALAFYGVRPKGLEINHIDGCKTNNKPDNLEYVTRSENCQHSFDIGLQKPKRGELNGMAKLTPDQVRWVREKKRTGGRFWGRNEIAKELGIAPKHLQKIVNVKEGDRIWMDV